MANQFKRVQGTPIGQIKFRNPKGSEVIGGAQVGQIVSFGSGRPGSQEQGLFQVTAPGKLRALSGETEARQITQSQQGRFARSVLPEFFKSQFQFEQPTSVSNIDPVKSAAQQQALGGDRGITRPVIDSQGRTGATAEDVLAQQFGARPTNKLTAQQAALAQAAKNRAGTSEVSLAGKTAPTPPPRQTTQLSPKQIQELNIAFQRQQSGTATPTDIKNLEFAQSQKGFIPGLGGVTTPTTPTETIPGLPQFDISGVAPTQVGAATTDTAAQIAGLSRVGEGGLTDIQNRIVELQQPTEKENSLQEELNTLNDAFRQSITKISGETIPLELLIGQSAQLERQAVDRASTLIDRLALLQSKREGEVNALVAKEGFQAEVAKARATAQLEASKAQATKEAAQLESERDLIEKGFREITEDQAANLDEEQVIRFPGTDKIFKAPTGSTGEQFSQAATLRKEFLGQSKNFIAIRDSFNRVKASVDDPSAAGDLALIFNFMKMLDPGSVVRESEFATAQNAAGIPDIVRNLYNRVLTGERLGLAQRADFQNRSQKLFEVTDTQQKSLINSFNSLAAGQGLNPDFVTIDIGIAEDNFPLDGQAPIPTPPGGPVLTEDKIKALKEANIPADVALSTISKKDPELKIFIDSSLLSNSPEEVLQFLTEKRQ